MKTYDMEKEIHELCKTSDFVIPTKALDFLLLLARENYSAYNCFPDDFKDIYQTCYKTVVLGCYVGNESKYNMNENDSFVLQPLFYKNISVKVCVKERKPLFIFFFCRSV
jgi:hypothetical protein